MNLRVLRHLLWKDARSVQPLVISAVLAIASLYALLFIYAKTTNDLFTEQTSIGYTIWVLIPTLFAFSLPAFLIGSEEESGALAWLRTLPAHWKAIALSKFLLAIGYTSLVWSLSTIAFGLFWATIPANTLEMADRLSGVPEPWYLHLLGQFALALALLLVSLITSYLFRSPITALVLVLPAMVLLLVAFAQSAALVVGPTPPLDTKEWVILIALYGATIVLLLAVKTWAAYRRIVAPESNLRHRLTKSGTTNNAYRPPHSTAATAGHFLRPSPTFALTWQFLRQSRWSLIGFTIAACIGVVVAHVFSVNPNDAGWMILATNLAIVSSIAIPCFAFYGDSARGRSQFLADRGIAPSLVWLTRVGPPAICALLIMSALLIMRWLTPHPSISMLSVTVIAAFGYAACQFISQWVSRPVLAFFAAPAVLCVAGLVFAILLDAYPNWIPVLLVSTALLWFASWRLTPSWMSRPSIPKADWRFLGYATLALALPFCIVLGTRWATMPSVDSSWRQRMVEFDFPSSGRDRVAILAQSPLSDRQASSVFERQRDETYLQNIEDELKDTEAVGGHVSFQDLIWDASARNVGQVSQEQEPLTEQEHTEAAIRSVRVFLKWSNVVREEAIAGRVRFYVLERTAEKAQQIAVELLTQLIERQGMTAEIAELCKQLPDSNLVRESRRSALVVEWRSTRGFQCFGAFRMSVDSWSNFLERPRGTRYAEKAIRLAMERWGAGVDLTQSDHERIEQYLSNADLDTDLLRKLEQYDLAAYGLRQRIRNSSASQTNE